MQKKKISFILGISGGILNTLGMILVIFASSLAMAFGGGPSTIFIVLFIILLILQISSIGAAISILKEKDKIIAPYVLIISGILGALTIAQDFKNFYVGAIPSILLMISGLLVISNNKRNLEFILTCLGSILGLIGIHSKGLGLFPLYYMLENIIKNNPYYFMYGIIWILYFLLFILGIIGSIYILKNKINISRWLLAISIMGLVITDIIYYNQLDNLNKGTFITGIETIISPMLITIGLLISLFRK